MVELQVKYQIWVRSGEVTKFTLIISELKSYIIGHPLSIVVYCLVRALNCSLTFQFYQESMSGWQLGCGEKP